MRDDPGTEQGNFHAREHLGEPRVWGPDRAMDNGNAQMIEIEQYWHHPLRLDISRLAELIEAEPHTPLDAVIATTLAALGCLNLPLSDLLASLA